MKMRPRQLFSVLAAAAVVLLSACGAPAPSTPTAVREYSDVGVKYQVVFEDDFACPMDLANRTFYAQEPPTLELQTSGGYWTVTIPQYWKAEYGGGYSEGLGMKTIGDARCQVTINNVNTTIKVPAQ